MRKLIAWVIEDDSMARTNAEKIIRRIVEQESLSLIIESSRRVAWPPKLESNKQDRIMRLPDLVVLDLFDEGFKGGDFYNWLRGKEQEEQKQSKSRIIIWSGYWSDRSAVEFVKKTLATDSRFILTETKDTLSLEDAVKGCLSQIEEEESVAGGY